MIAESPRRASARSAVPASWSPAHVAHLVVDLRHRLARARDELMAGAVVEGEREVVRFELDQLDAALASDSPATGTAYAWRRVRERVGDVVPAARPINTRVHELFGAG
jgi:hypothetical protein